MDIRRHRIEMMPIDQMRQHYVPHLPPVILVGVAATLALPYGLDVYDPDVALSLNGTSLPHIALHEQNHGGVILEMAAGDVIGHDDGSKRIIDS